MSQIKKQIVIPAQAGIRRLTNLDSRLRGNDVLRWNDETLKTISARKSVED